MKSKLGYFIASFVISAIMIGTVCAFMLVDLGSDRYMPGQFGPLLQINSLESGRASVTFMGTDYIIGGESMEDAAGFIYRFRAFLPTAPRLAGRLMVLLEEKFTGNGVNIP